MEQPGMTGKAAAAMLVDADKNDEALLPRSKKITSTPRHEAYPFPI
jgi:hypothetical protein